jgi:NTP pyrophosphatase (non-canonical NTP hydrolase)
VSLTIREAQTAVWANKLAKGFNTTDVSLEFNLLTEELGEAIKAWRHGDGLAGELADVALYVMSLAEMTGVDLGEAVAEKMAVNRARRYMQTETGAFVKVEAVQ